MRRTAPLFAFLTLVGLLAFPTGAARAEDDDLQARALALGTETGAKLATHAAWCAKKKLFGKRDEAYERLLAFEPDHKQARKKLKYKRDEEHAWVQNPRYKRPRNLAKKGQAEADATLAAILEAQITGLLAICGSAETIPQLLWARSTLAGLHSTHPGRRDIAPIERTLALRYHAASKDKALVKEMVETEDWLRERYGTDLAVRDALGEVTRDDLWLLRESARTLDQVAGLDATIAEAQKVTPTAAEATKVEARIELPWSQAVATTHVRVAGTADPKDLAKVATACEAAGALFEQALGTAPAWRAGLTVYLFAKKDERATFLKGFPTVDNVTLKHQDQLDLVYADGQTLVVRALQARGQLDLSVNEILNQMVADTFLGSETPLAWHAEGISRYLAWKLTGTRMAINVSSGKYAGDAQDRAVPDADAQWLVKVRAQLTKKPASLQMLLGKGTDTFSARDALVAYGFAVYLIEGHAGLAGEFLKLHYKTKDVDRGCRDLLGMPRAVIEERLPRWLDEVIAQQKGNR